jgi:hypothetical protein
MCEDREKQQLLETTSVTLRLRIGVSLLQVEVEQLVRQVDQSTSARFQSDFDRSLLN